MARLYRLGQTLRVTQNRRVQLNFEEGHWLLLRNLRGWVVFLAMPLSAAVAAGGHAQGQSFSA